jgi:zinc protease
MGSGTARGYLPPALNSSPVHLETLANGLTVLLREVHVASVAEVQVWAAVGSADERPGEEGLAHFHEHMLFKGTERRGVGEITAAVEGVGGHINAYTSFDVTCYHATLPSAETSVGLDVLADSVQHSLFDPEEIDREIEVVLEEIRSAEDDPHHVLSDALFRTAYQVHPYRAPILGTPESVAAFNHEKLASFYGRWYTPERLVVVAVGDFEIPRILQEISTLFADAQPGKAFRNRATEPVQTALRTTLLWRPFERACLDLSWSTVDFRHPDAPLLDLLAFVLGEGESCRLVQRVKEESGLVDRIDASSYTPLDSGLFGAVADLDPGNTRAAVEAVLRETEMLRAEPVAEEELEKARANFLAGQHWERESVAGLARKIGSFHLIAGDHRHEADYLERIRTATSEELQRVAKEWLAPERLTVAAVVPDGAEPRLDAAAIEEAVARGIGEASRAFRRPRTRERVSGILSYELENGIKIHVVPRREVPVVAIRAVMLGGLLAETRETAGISNFLASMWLRGTRALSAADFARQVESLAADIDGFSGRNSIGLTLDATSEKLLPALDLFAEVVLAPAFGLEEIERERRDTLAAIARRNDRLGARVFDLFCRTHFRTHPYGLPIPGTPDAVSGISREDLIACHERLARPDNLVIAVVGDVEPDDMAAHLARRLGALDGEAFDGAMPDVEPAPSEIRYAEEYKDRAQAHLLIGFRGITVHDEDRDTLEVIAQILGGHGGRLFRELRDRHGLAYSVSAFSVEGIAAGFFATHIATAAEKFDEAKQGILEELARVTESPPSADELLRAQRFLVGNFAIGQQRSSARALQVALDARYGLGPAADRDYPDRIQQITREDVLRVARRIIDLDAYTITAIRPGSG